MATTEATVPDVKMTTPIHRELAAFPQPLWRLLVLGPVGGGLLDQAPGAERCGRSGDRLMTLAEIPQSRSAKFPTLGTKGMVGL